MMFAFTTQIMYFSGYKKEIVSSSLITEMKNKAEWVSASCVLPKLIYDSIA